jgi:hypothetical protein
VQQIRVLLAGAPGPLHAAVRAAVALERDLIIVGQTSGEVETLLDAGRVGADVVVVGMSAHRLPPVAERLVDEFPSIGVLGIDLDRNEVAAYRLRPQVVRIAGGGGPGLVAAIRQAAQRSY